MKKMIILGCGNILAGDDAVGIEVARQLKGFSLPEGVRVVEAGSPGITLLDLMTGYDKAIIVDAVVADKKPGSVLRLGTKDICCEPVRLVSGHYFGASEALELGRVLNYGIPEEVVIIGIVIEEPKYWVVGLSPTVRAAVREAVDIVLKEIGVRMQT